MRSTALRSIVEYGIVFVGGRDIGLAVGVAILQFTGHIFDDPLF